MNKKHINAQLCKIFDAFVNSIQDEKVKTAVNNGTIITGGSIVSLLQNEKPHDYDMYFKDFETCYIVANYFINQFNLTSNNKKIAELKIQDADFVKKDKSWVHEGKWIDLEKARLQVAEESKEPRIKVFIKSKGVAGLIEDNKIDTEEDKLQTNIEPDTDINKEIEEEPKYKIKFITSNAISLSEKIQLIIRFYGEPEKIHENYDFVHCTNYWTSWNRKVVLKIKALEAIMNKELLYVGSKYPLCSIVRTRKFINRGWTINAGQYLKMCMQLNDLDLKDVNVLEDQLVGVDSGYFQMLINVLRKKHDDDSNFKINNTYVAAIIDKLF